MLDAQVASGMSVAEFASSRRLDAQRLYSWRRRLSRETRSAFVEVARPSELVEPAPATIEVALRSGDVVRVIGGVNVSDFRAVVEVLRSC